MYQIRLWPCRRRPFWRANSAIRSALAKLKVPSLCRICSIFISQSAVTWEKLASSRARYCGSSNPPTDMAAPTGKGATDFSGGRIRRRRRRLRLAATGRQGQAGRHDGAAGGFITGGHAPMLIRAG